MAIDIKFKLDMYDIFDSVVENYRKDFVYDLDMVENTGGKMVWFLRKNGTHLVSVDLLGEHGVEQYLSANKKYYLVFAKMGILQELTADEVRELVELGGEN